MDHLETPPTKVLTVSESKALVDDFLMPVFDQLARYATSIDPHYETLWRSIQKLYSAGGKRLRSYMTLSTFAAYSNQPYSTILPAAAAQELLHLALLIHDDIIDRDDIRYGVKNVTRQYIDHYQELLGDEATRRHYANSAALLAGDLLISQAYSLISETSIDPAAIVATQKVLSQAIFRVAGGELLDTEAAFRGSNAADPLIIAQQKTASYSFVGPLLMGATLAQVNQQQQDLLQQLGENLGIAYQLHDDILGVFGDEEVTGKSASSDLIEGKRTLLIAEFYKHADAEQRVIFDSAFGKPADKQAIETMKNLLVTTGAKSALEQRIEQYRQRADEIVQALDINNSDRQKLSALIELCVRREK